MKNNFKHSLSLVAAASATCFSVVLLAGCGGGNGGLSPTPTSVDPNGTAPFSAFARPGVKPDIYLASCPRQILEWKDGDREYFAYFRYVKIDSGTIPSGTGISYECAFDGRKLGMEYRTTRLPRDEFVKRLMEPKRWGHHYGTGTLTCELLSDCTFWIAKTT